MIKRFMTRHLAALIAAVMLAGNLAAPALAAEAGDDYSAQVTQEEQRDSLNTEDTAMDPGPEDGDSLSFDLKEESAPEEAADEAGTTAAAEEEAGKRLPIRKIQLQQKNLKLRRSRLPRKQKKPFLRKRTSLRKRPRKRIPRQVNL